MGPTTILAKDVRKGAQIAWFGGQTATVVTVRNGRDPGGDYLIVVVELSEELYVDFRLYGNTPSTYEFELAS